jgi:hypothetical protein
LRAGILPGVKESDNASDRCLSASTAPPADIDLPSRREPVYAYWGGSNLYLNLTSRCPLACGFCLRNFTWEVCGYDLRLSLEEEPAVDQVLGAAFRVRPLVTPGSAGSGPGRPQAGRPALGTPGLG